MGANNLTRSEAAERSRIIEVDSYDIHLDLTQGEQTFGSKTVAVFSCREPGASVFMDLDAREVISITLNGQVVPNEACEGKRLYLNDLAATNTLEVVAKCPYSHTGYGMHRFVDPEDGEVYLYTDFEPFQAHRVYACFDQPDLKATFTFAVVAPAGWRVFSNMKPEARPAEGETGEWRFLTTPRISTYYTAVVAGPYEGVTEKHGDVDLGAYCRRSLFRFMDHEEILTITKQAFDFFPEAFGYPYVFGKYDQIFVPEYIQGAMENAGCITLNEMYIYRSKVTEAHRERRAVTIIHELAHMWFGDLVTMKWWDDLWLNESFATFAEVFARTRVTRFTDGWVLFANTFKTVAREADQQPTTHPIAADIPDTLSSTVNFDAISYYKGASVLRQLVAWIGEEAFFEGMQHYFRRFEYSNADLNDFLDALAEASGRDVHAWSKEWIETAGLNTLRAEAASSGGKYSSFRVIQEAPEEHPTLRTHRLAVGLYDRRDSKIVRRKRVELEVSGGSTEVPALVGEDEADLVIVNDGDLTYCKLVLDPRSAATITDGLRFIEDPLTRALCWAAAWDMVGDARMSASAYVDLVLANLFDEKDVGVVSSVAWHPTLPARTFRAVDLFSAPANRDPLRAKIAEAGLRFARESEPGSDVQHIWLQAFAVAAVLPDHHRTLEGLLEGTESLPGCELGPLLRWHILLQLASKGRVGADVIEAELAADPSDEGERAATQALAAIPSPENKERVWQAITTDPQLPRARMVAMMTGFQRPRQEALMEPYVERYFEALKPMWTNREAEISTPFALAMYPRILASPQLVDRTNRFISEMDPPETIRRTLIEQRHLVEKALLAQATDLSGTSGPGGAGPAR